MINGVPEIYAKLNVWQDGHEQMANITNNYLNSFQTQFENGQISEDEALFAFNEVSNMYNEAAGDIGYEFDFMNGKDPNNKDDYNEAISILAQGEIAQKDSDKDGEISYDEYLNFELGDSVGEMSEEDKKAAEEIAKLFFDEINQAQDENDTTLDLEDMQNFYKTLDSYNVAEGEINDAFAQTQKTDVQDGKIHMNASMDFLNGILKKKEVA